MATAQPTPAPDVDSCVDANDAAVASWLLALHHRPRSTQRVYGSALKGYTGWLAQHRPGVGVFDVGRDDCRAYFVDLERAGLEGNTRRNYWTALRSFYRWAVEEEEVELSPMAKVHQPQATDRPVRVLRDVDLGALLAVCRGKEFPERRDLALIRTMAATGLRVSEVTALTRADVDLVNRLLIVRKGKGDKARVVRMDSSTAAVIDRYLRARARHKHQASPALWLGLNGRLSVGAVQLMVSRRATQAGIGHLHAHMLRHTWAHRMKSAGASDEVVKELGGWDSSEVMRRYGRSVATERALAAYDAVNPMGDL